MSGGVPERDDAHLRISHDDRERVAELLRVAAGDGRIDLAELDERLESAYAARTVGDLVPLTADLPVVAVPESGTPPRPAAPMPPQPLRGLAVMGRYRKSGAWVVPSELTVTGWWAGVHLDLRRAVFTAPETQLTVNVVMAGATILVDPGTEVHLEGTGVMGAFSGPSGLVAARLGPDSPVLRVRGVAIWGGVTVERRH